MMFLYSYCIESTVQYLHYSVQYIKFIHVNMYKYKLFYLNIEYISKSTVLITTSPSRDREQYSNQLSYDSLICSFHTKHCCIYQTNLMGLFIVKVYYQLCTHHSAILQELPAVYCNQKNMWPQGNTIAWAVRYVALHSYQLINITV